MNLYVQKTLRRCIQAGFLGILVTLVFMFVANAPFQPAAVAYGFLLGFLSGCFEVFVLGRLKIRRLWFLSTLRMMGYFALILLTMFILAAIIESQTPDQVSEQLLEQRFLRYILQSVIVAFTISTFLQIESIIGIGIFKKLVSGRYLSPRKELRFFMFIDLNSSTRIAVELGDEDYYNFLNTFFRDLSIPALQTNAEIYKYIGDEIILSWSERDGRKNNNALQLYFQFLKNIEKNRAFYMKRFGQIPTFKASLHFGEVISARVGDLKKELAYNGDVINTASRIIEKCRPMNKPFLISEDAYLALEDVTNRKFTMVPDVSLEGKEERINLYTAT